MRHASEVFKEGHLMFAKRMIKKTWPQLENKEFDVKEIMETCPKCEQDTMHGLEVLVEGKDEWRRVPQPRKQCKDCENKELQQRAKGAHKAHRSKRFWKPNPELENATFATFEPQDQAQVQALNTAAQYVKDFKNGDRYNLVLRGPYGAGKSHLAKSIGESMKAAGYSVGFLTEADLFTMIKNTYNRESGITEEQLLNKIHGDGDKEPGLDLFILDELGAETATDWEKGKIISFVNSRQGLNTIYTTNEADGSLERLFTGRVVSRLNSNTKFEEVETDIDMRKDKRRG